MRRRDVNIQELTNSRGLGLRIVEAVKMESSQRFPFQALKRGTLADVPVRVVGGTKEG